MIERWSDEYGTYESENNLVFVIERTNKWRDENPPLEPEPQLPSETEVLNDYIVDVDYRVTMIELGL
ncbi:MAG: hypothetical protein ABS938_00265 [Psychrobacillus psychrodurans]